MKRLIILTIITVSIFLSQGCDRDKPSLIESAEIQVAQFRETIEEVIEDSDRAQSLTGLTDELLDIFLAFQKEETVYCQNNQPKSIRDRFYAASLK